MNDELDSILSRMQQLEKELLRALQRKETEFAYKVRQKKIRFTAEAEGLNKTFRKRVSRFLRDSRVLVLLTTPVIWSVLLPIALLDLAISIYQGLCFPISTPLGSHSPSWRESAALPLREVLNSHGLADF